MNKALCGILVAGLIASGNQWHESYFYNKKVMKGNAIYIPKRHKFKRRGIKK